ncbi:MAG: Ig domain-containing protein, partial [Bacilli bacterium]|nr:Ig domain-containing protein [Bacilli bacterium]
MKKSKKLILLGGVLIATALASCAPVESSSSDTEPSSSQGIEVTGVTLNAATLEIGVGKTAQLTATITPENAANKNLSWTSANPSVATVSAEGVVTGVALGTTLVTVTTEDGNRTASCAITVKENTIAVTGVELNVETLEMVEGETETLVATVLPLNASDKAVEWSSDNKSKVTVDQNGVVTAVEAGEAFVTVRTVDGGFEKSVEVFVSP